MLVSASPSPTPGQPAPDRDWRTVNWSAHERSILIRGHRVNLVDLGAGTPVLFIHGLSGCWQNWLLNIAAIARDHRVIAIDLPGFGASQMPEGPISVPSYAETVTLVCRALGLDSVAVVGNSMGGFIAAEMSIGTPELVSHLVLVDAAGLSTEELRHRPLYALARLARSSGLTRLSRVPDVARRPGLRRLALGLIARHPERFSADLTRTLLGGAGKEGFPEALLSLSSHRIRDRLDRIGCPTLIVWGANDRLVPVADAFELQQSIAGSQLVVFPDSGHVPMLEYPLRFNRVLEGFLSAEGGRSPSAATGFGRAASRTTGSP